MGRRQHVNNCIDSLFSFIYYVEEMASAHKIGERILELVMASDRAAAVVGDLQEHGMGPARFWLAIGSNLLHAINSETLIGAGKACLLQFLFPFALLPLLMVGTLRMSFVRWQLITTFVLLISQVLTGYWITRQKETQRVLICLLVVAADCALGLLKVNNGSINLAIWSVPLLAVTIMVQRGSRRSHSRA